MPAAVSVHERSGWIVDFLRRQSEPQTIRTIWENARQPKGSSGSAGGLEDDATLPTYHRTIAKLLRTGQVEEVGSGDGATLYRASEQLSPFNTYTIDDLKEALWEQSIPEGLAAYLDAVDYFERESARVLSVAATRLLSEDPRSLVLAMLKDTAASLVDDIEILKDPNADDVRHRVMTERELEALRMFVHGGLGIGASVWALNKSLDQLIEGDPLGPPNWASVEEALNNRVFGDTFLRVVDAPASSEFHSIVAGSDGSSHAGYVRGIPAPQYVEEEGRLTLTFNNSVAYVDVPPSFPLDLPSPYHGVPMTRAALEDPHNRGMVISRAWYDDLQDSEFEHMKKAALDVVQYRVDERLMSGMARAYGTSSSSSDPGMLPRPNLLIRDGAVAPQEREFHHYFRRDSYGDITYEGIQLSYRILRTVMDSETRVFAGAVKFTQLKTFSTILSWFIQKYIASDWDKLRASVISDGVAITRLIMSLPELPPGKYYASCVIARPFSALPTQLRSVTCETEEEWLEYFRHRQQDQITTYNRHGGQRSRLIGLDLEDDAYVRMCQLANYATFYFGRPGGEPELTLPRFEFLDSLRNPDPMKNQRRVERSVQTIIAGVHHTKWSLDKDHNYLSQRRMPRLIPYVVYEAHEKCKALGHKLENELRQAIALRLSQLKALRGLAIPKIDIEPVPISEYLRRVGKLLSNKAKEDK